MIDKTEIIRKLEEELSEDESKLIKFLLSRVINDNTVISFYAKDYAEYCGIKDDDGLYNKLTNIIKKLKITAIDYTDDNNDFCHIVLLTYFIMPIHSDRIECKINEKAMPFLKLFG